MDSRASLGLELEDWTPINGARLNVSSYRPESSALAHAEDSDVDSEEQCYPIAYP